MCALLVLLAITPGLAQNATSLEPTKMVYGEACTEAEYEEYGEPPCTTGICIKDSTRAKRCEPASRCYSHTGACKEDGTFASKQCQQAVLCAPCYPNSRCGGLLKKVDPDLPEAMIYGETCIKDSRLAKVCGPAWRCFSHTTGACKEDGTFPIKQCKPAVPCAPCYPNSRCGGMRDATNATTTTTTRQDEEAHWASASVDKETASAEHMASSSSACMLVMLILQSGLHTWTFFM